MHDGGSGYRIDKRHSLRLILHWQRAYDWCLDRDEVVMLEPFGQAPSHPALYNPEKMDLETISLVQDALEALNEDQEGADILWDLLYTKDMIPTNAQDHLGTYGAAISNVPGIQAYFGRA